MPEQYEIHWLWYYGIAFGILWVLFAITTLAKAERRYRKSTDDRRTHRRTWPKW